MSEAWIMTLVWLLTILFGSVVWPAFEQAWDRHPAIWLLRGGVKKEM